MTRLTRRNLFAAAAAVAAAVPAADAQAQAPPSPASSKDEDLKSARDSMASNAALLAKVDVPMNVEPAFSFKA